MRRYCRPLSTRCRARRTMPDAAVKRDDGSTALVSGDDASRPRSVMLSPIRRAVPSWIASRLAETSS